MFSLSFPDGSEFSLPKEWGDVFADSCGPNLVFYPAIADRLRFMTGKYVEYRAWPSKFAGRRMKTNPPVRRRA
jgi:hypothetical protein